MFNEELNLYFIAKVPIKPLTLCYLQFFDTHHKCINRALSYVRVGTKVALISAYCKSINSLLKQRYTLSSSKTFSFFCRSSENVGIFTVLLIHSVCERSFNF